MSPSDSKKFYEKAYFKKETVSEGREDEKGGRGEGGGGVKTNLASISPGMPQETLLLLLPKPYFWFRIWQPGSAPSSRMMQPLSISKWCNRDSCIYFDATWFHPGLGIRSNQMSDCERFAHIAQDKWATVSKSLRSLRGNEQPWANRSGRSRQMSDPERFAQRKRANEPFAQKMLAKKI